MEKQTRQLLIKFLNNQCTVKEEQQVNQLLEQPEMLALLYRLMREQDAAAEEGTSISNDSLAPKITGWQQRINQRIASSGGHNNGRKGRIRLMGRSSWLRYAAVLAGLLIMVSLVFRQLNKKTFMQEVMVVVENTNPQRNPGKYILPDGTRVFLARGGRLQYPRDFTGNVREISLEGDAFFEVAQNVAKPFIVRSGKINTRVLGTSFRIKTTADQSVIVSVATGKVNVSQQSETEVNQLAILTGGKKVTWNANTRQATEGTVDPYALEQWKEGDLFFDEETMSEIAAELEERYGIKIRFNDDEIRAKRVSGSFAAEKPVDKIILTLSVAGKFGFKSNDGKEFTIYKKN